MTSNREAELRAMLLARKQDLEVIIRERLSSVRDERTAAERGGVLDDSEVSDRDLHDDIELMLVQMTRETLGRVDAALERLHEGHYGRCAECGDDISPARLRALPFAVRCLDCEDERERDARRQRQRERGSRIAFDSAPGFD
jgi:DnaK suppressor protein